MRLFVSIILIFVPNSSKLREKYVLTNLTMKTLWNSSKSLHNFGALFVLWRPLKNARWGGHGPLAPLPARHCFKMKRNLSLLENLESQPNIDN